MEETTPQSLFAGRYRFIDPPDDDWDIGRSGFAQPATDVQTKRLVVIKHTDPTSPHADRHEQSLQNEAKALKALQGMGVPDLYSDDQADYGSSRRFTYLVMEYIDGLRVEKELYRLEPLERAYIITELLRLLAIAHSRGIANGDIDLKHLFWRREQRKLVVIDWGNASLGVDTQKSSLFAYDLARCAEIIYALVTRKGSAHPTGSLALPSELYPGLAPLPDEFYALCEWAPRNPADDIRTTLSALSLYQSSKKWLQRLEPEYKPDDSLLHKPSVEQERNPPQHKHGLLLSAFIFAALFGLALFIFGQFVSPPPHPTNTPTTEQTPLTVLTSPPTTTSTPVSEIVPSVETPAASTPTATGTPTPTTIAFTIPTPGTYANPVPLKDVCSPNEVSTTTSEGLQLRTDNTWQFRIQAGRETNYRVESDLSKCHGLDAQSLAAISLYAYAFKIAQASEFGLFLEYENGLRQEYTLWTDDKNFVYLRFRESNASPIDQQLLLIPPTPIPGISSKYYQYSAMLFLEITNSANLFYLNPGRGFITLKPAEILPSLMFRMDSVIRPLPARPKLAKFGLVGYGPDVQILLLPLSFYTTP